MGNPDLPATEGIYSWHFQLYCLESQKTGLSGLSQMELGLGNFPHEVVCQCGDWNGTAEARHRLGS